MGEAERNGALSQTPEDKTEHFDARRFTMSTGNPADLMSKTLYYDTPWRFGEMIHVDPAILGPSIIIGRIVPKETE